MSESRKKPLLFEEYPDLEGNIPWVNLAPLRTPVKKLTKLEEELGINSLWVKCDDLTSPLYGGNKARKLEFVLAEALSQGCEKVMTAGYIGSNHCVANAVFCNQLNLKPIAVLIDQPVTVHVRNNLLLDLYFKNEIVYNQNEIPKDNNIYHMVPGASMPLGILGFVNAMIELRNQVNNGEIPEPDYIFVASGTAGTAAGLALGIKLVDLKTQIHAVEVADPMNSSIKIIRRLAKKTNKLMAKYENPVSLPTYEHLFSNGDYFGGQYGLPTRVGLDAINIIKEVEDIQLEPTYTGKTFAALLGFVRAHKIDIKNKTILFWNTYNSRDFSDILKKVDYHDLPEDLHWVFEGPLTDYG